MTPTSDERREVAAMLRKAWPEAGGMEEVWEVLDPILGTHDGPDVYKAWEQTFNRLADLIDPTCHPVPSDGSKFECSECGGHLGAVLPAIGAVVPKYCPRCGARVTDGGER